MALDGRTAGLGRAAGPVKAAPDRDSRVCAPPPGPDARPGRSPAPVGGRRSSAARSRRRRPRSAPPGSVPPARGQDRQGRAGGCGTFSRARTPAPRLRRRRRAPTSPARRRRVTAAGRAGSGNPRRRTAAAFRSRHSRSGEPRGGRSAAPPPPGTYRRAVTIERGRGADGGGVRRLRAALGRDRLRERRCVRTVVLALLVGLAAGDCRPVDCRPAPTRGHRHRLREPRAPHGTARPGRSTSPTWAPGRSTRSAGSPTDT